MNLLDHPFLIYAFVAGTAIALAAGLVGYFLVLRAQVFLADALSHVAFTGAFAALVAGLDARVGLFTVTALVALAMGGLGRRAKPDDVVIGGMFAWILGIGVLLLTVYTSTRSGTGSGSASVSVLFGSVFGLSAQRAAVAVAVALVICATVLAIARPLLLISLDEEIAMAQGVPVRLLGFGFLLLVAGTAAEATQVVGALLILGLLAAPAATAIRLTSRPLRALGLSAAIAVASVWIGLTAGYLLPRVPPSFAILAVATGAYLCSLLVTGSRGGKPRLRRGLSTP